MAGTIVSAESRYSICLSRQLLGIAAPESPIRGALCRLARPDLRARNNGYTSASIRRITLLLYQASPWKLHRRCSVGRSNPIQSTEASDCFGAGRRRDRRIEKEERSREGYAGP